MVTIRCLKGMAACSLRRKSLFSQEEGAIVECTHKAFLACQALALEVLLYLVPLVSAVKEALNP